jgi:hypothetical protein
VKASNIQNSQKNPKADIHSLAGLKKMLKQQNNGQIFEDMKLYAGPEVAASSRRRRQIYGEIIRYSSKLNHCVMVR